MNTYVAECWANQKLAEAREEAAGRPSWLR